MYPLAGRSLVHTRYCIFASVCGGKCKFSQTRPPRRARVSGPRVLSYTPVRTTTYQLITSIKERHDPQEIKSALETKSSQSDIGPRRPNTGLPQKPRRAECGAAAPSLDGSDFTLHIFAITSPPRLRAACIYFACLGSFRNLRNCAQTLHIFSHTIPVCP